jgi:CRISPR-associated protein Csm1
LLLNFRLSPIRQAKSLLSWPASGTSLNPLRLLFDRVHLSQGQNREHYWPATFIEGSNPQIPYPQFHKPTSEDLDILKQKIKETLTPESLNSADWQNLSLLTLILEKFGSYISFGEEDVSLVDIARSTAAVAAAIANNPGAKDLSLVAGDLSGIQKFIYTISSDGALKSLRARSFYLELVTEEVVQQLLAALNLPRNNIIYAGGGNLYILAAATEETKDAVKKVRQQLNQWLLEKFQGKVFLALDCLTFPIEEVATDKFAEHWSDVITKLAEQKSRKFADSINDLIQRRKAYEPCRVCHRDDLATLEQLNRKEPDSVLACGTCRDMFDLGGQLLRVKAIVRSHREDIPGALDTISLKLPAGNVYYYLFSSWKPIVHNPETVFLVNDWEIEHYQFRHFKNSVTLLLGNYGQESQKPSESSEESVGFMTAGEMAEKAQGIPRVGYLRMDVDRLGQIFATGLKQNQNIARNQTLEKKQLLPRLAVLSRQMSYFFKVYLNSLAENRLENLPKNEESITTLTKEPRPNLLFIYAGGDDLFVSGAWNEVVEFGFDVYQCFREYTGNHPDITLSGGISLAGVKFPLYQAARESGNAEEAAKENGRDSLGLFGNVFKWGEWLGNENIKVADIKVIDSETKAYLGESATLSLFGILPFVNILERQINYTRSFVRNLLITAQTQEQMLENIKNERRQQQYENELKDIRYYLHLPKIAYTLARLPSDVRDADNFKPVRTSLLSPYNAPYFRAIATWIELLNRTKTNDTKPQ